MAERAVLKARRGCRVAPPRLRARAPAISPRPVGTPLAAAKETGYDPAPHTEVRMVDEMENPPPEPPTTPKKERELLIVQSKVRELIRSKEKRASDEFITALSEHVQQVVEKAIARATANNRSTLRDADI